jgi:hypothetical protein
MLRPWLDKMPLADGPAYTQYREEMTFRWAVICHTCYRTLDNDCGRAEVAGRLFNLAGRSRGDRAAIVDESKYQAFQRQQAARLGIDL